MANEHRVAVIGGTGYLGSRIVEVLRRTGRWSVVPCARRGAERGVDVDDPSTFGALDDCPWVIHAADTLQADPSALYDHCLAQGKSLIETSSSGRVIEGQLARLARVPMDTRGRILLGAGLFPGLSNLLAVALRDRAQVRRRLEVALTASPLSGAGAGVCDLMVDLLRHNAIAYEDGQRTEHPPASAGPLLPFSDRARRTVRVALPESAMLFQATGVPHIATYFAARPRFVQLVLRLLAAWGVVRIAWFAQMMRTGLRVLRSRLLRPIPTRIELLVLGDRLGEHRPLASRTSLVAQDGMDACAHGVVAMLEAFQLSDPVPGVYLPEELLELDDVLDRMRALGAKPVRFAHPLPNVAAPPARRRELPLASVSP